MRLLLLSAAFASAAPIASEVVSADGSGFEVGSTLAVAAPPSKVWATLIAPARWWDAAHSWSGSAFNLTLDARPGGCFCEQLPDGGGVEHLRVVHAAPQKLLRMTGGLGPLQADALAGVLTVELKPVGQGTTVTFTYAVAGRRTGGLSALAMPVDRMLAGQLARLKASVERR